MQYVAPSVRVVEMMIDTNLLSSTIVVVGRGVEPVAYEEL